MSQTREDKLSAASCVASGTIAAILEVIKNEAEWIQNPKLGGLKFLQMKLEDIEKCLDKARII